MFVLANIRGGGEFGPAWHEAGLKTHRQIIYDDFAVGRARSDRTQDHEPAPARHPGRIERRPADGRGVHPASGTVECGRHPGAAARHAALREDRGRHVLGRRIRQRRVPGERAFLAKISPYNNIHKGTQYPEPFIWTTTKDDRVGPQHARKFAARLSEYGIPYLFYEVTEGGHGSGANLKEQAHTTALEDDLFHAEADELAFQRAVEEIEHVRFEQARAGWRKNDRSRAA